MQRRDFRIPFPSQANGLTVQVTNDQLLDSKKVITFLIMPPMINNFGGFVKHQVTLVRIKEDEGKKIDTHENGDIIPSLSIKTLRPNWRFLQTFMRTRF